MDGSYEFCSTKKNQDFPILRRKSSASTAYKKTEKTGKFGVKKSTLNLNSNSSLNGGFNNQSAYWSESFSPSGERSVDDENGDIENGDVPSFEPQNVRVC